MSDESLESVLRTLSNEHDDIQKHIIGLRKYWHEVNELGRGPKYEEMTDRLHELRDLLVDHFREEERGGYLSPALSVAPQFRDQATSLHEEHNQFLRDLDTLIEKMRSCDKDCWRRVREELDGLVSRVQVHESAENSILRHAASVSARPTAT